MDTKGLSSALLQMKFMQRTKIRLEEEVKRKEERKLQKSFLGKKQEGKMSGKSEDNKQSITFENRYDILEDHLFGRLSFKGFNPEVEKLMKYHKDLKEGKKPDEIEFNDEQDVTDDELATSVFSTLGKKFEKGRFRGQHTEKNEGRTLIDETNEQRGKRKRRSDENRTESGSRKRQYR